MSWHLRSAFPGELPKSGAILFLMDQTFRFEKILALFTRRQ